MVFSPSCTKNQNHFLGGNENTNHFSREAKKSTDFLTRKKKIPLKPASTADFLTKKQDLQNPKIHAENRELSETIFHFTKLLSQKTQVQCGFQINRTIIIFYFQFLG